MVYVAGRFNPIMFYEVTQSAVHCYVAFYLFIGADRGVALTNWEDFSK